MLRAYRYPLKPTKAQAAVFARWLDLCRDLYNAALQERRDAYRVTGKSPTKFDQMKSLTEIRRDLPEYAEMPAVLSRSPLIRLDRAFQAFFRRCRSGERPGHPRFRSRDRYDSFDLGNAFKVVNDRVHIPKLGPVKFHRYRTLCGTPRCATIRRTARGWQLSVVMDVGPAPEKRPIASMVGIDLGLKTFATLSDGTKIDNPRFFRASETLLARRQRSLARKCKGSQNRCDARKLVARAHERIREQRRDFACKVAATLFRQYDAVAYEDLNVKGMARGMLAKSVNDAAWGELIWRIQCKAEGAGTWALPVDPCGTTIRCSKCDANVPKELGERTHRCPHCGLVLCRDENAARNILTLGRSVRREALGYETSLTREVSK